MLLSKRLVRMEKIDGNKLFWANMMFDKESWSASLVNGEGRCEKQEKFTCIVGLYRK